MHLFQVANNNSSVLTFNEAEMMKQFVAQFKFCILCGCCDLSAYCGGYDET